MQEIGQGHAVCLPAFNLHQGTAIYHLSEVKTVLNTKEWSEVPWLRMLRIHKCSGQKNLMGFLGLKCACLDTVSSDYIWLSFCICQIRSWDGLKVAPGARLRPGQAGPEHKTLLYILLHYTLSSNRNSLCFGSAVITGLALH